MGEICLESCGWCSRSESENNHDSLNRALYKAMWCCNANIRSQQWSTKFHNKNVSCVYPKEIKTYKLENNTYICLIRDRTSAQLFRPCITAIQWTKEELSCFVRLPLIKFKKYTFSIHINSAARINPIFDY